MRNERLLMIVAFEPLRSWIVDEHTQLAHLNFCLRLNFKRRTWRVLFWPLSVAP